MCVGGGRQGDIGWRERRSEPPPGPCHIYDVVHYSAEARQATLLVRIGMMLSTECHGIRHTLRYSFTLCPPRNQWGGTNHPGEVSSSIIIQFNSFIHDTVINMFCCSPSIQIIN